MDQLVRCEVIGDLLVVSIDGYDENGKPIYRDKQKGQIAHFDPAETNVDALVSAGLVKRAPETAAKKGTKEA